MQAEYVADIKLRNINQEYILKRIEEVAGLEEEIADLQAIISDPGRIKQIIVSELELVKKKYAQPRRTEIVYEFQAAAEAEDAQDVPDYPVHVFCSREGYFKKITPQSLRMSGEQKLKEGDEIAQQLEDTNSTDLLFFSDRCQVYKLKASDFDDTKASVLGEYIPAKAQMDEGERAVYLAPTKDYAGFLLFFFENGKAAKVEMSAYQTKTNRKKLISAYSDKSPLATALYLREDCEVLLTASSGRMLLFHTGLIQPKATKSTQGIQAMNLKKGPAGDGGRCLGGGDAARTLPL